MSDYDNAVEIAERVSDALDRLATATREAAHLQVAALLWTCADNRGATSWQATMEMALDLSEELDAERERRREREREARRTARAAQEQTRAQQEARLAEIEAELAAGGERLTDTAGPGCPSYGEVLEDEASALRAELFG